MGDEGDDVADVAVLDVDGRAPQAHGESGEHAGGEEQGSEQDRPARYADEKGEDDEEQQELDREVHQAAAEAGQGENEPGEVDLGQEARRIHDAVGGAGEAACEVHPRQQADEHHQRIRDAWSALQASDDAEDERTDRGLRERFKEGPAVADDALAIVGGDIAPDEESEEVSILPDFGKIECGPAGGWLDDFDVFPRRGWRGGFGRGGGSLDLGRRSEFAGVCSRGCHEGRHREQSNMAVGIRPGSCLWCMREDNSPAGLGTPENCDGR